MDTSLFMALTGIIFITFPSISAQTSITLDPENDAQYINDKVELACEVQNSVHELEWYDCRAPLCVIMYRDGSPVGGYNPPPRYSIVDRSGSSGKRHDFLIVGVQTSDGGQFRCRNTFDSSEAYAEVIAIVPDIDCSSNMTGGHEVEEGEFIYLSSELTLHGRWLPVGKFKDPNDVEVPGRVDESSGNTARYSVVVKAETAFQGQRFSAEWFFDPVTGTLPHEATNTPDFPTPNSCDFQPITVYYPPENLAIQRRDNNEYHVGETIACTVGDGHPTPSLKWTNLNDTGDVTDCGTFSLCQLTVPVGMIGETLMYECQACNNYFSQDHCDSDTIVFITYVTTTTTTKTTITPTMRTTITPTIHPTTSLTDMSSSPTPTDCEHCLCCTGLDLHQDHEGAIKTVRVRCYTAGRKCCC